MCIQPAAADGAPFDVDGSDSHSAAICNAVDVTQLQREVGTVLAAFLWVWICKNKFVSRLEVSWLRLKSLSVFTPPLTVKCGLPEASWERVFLLLRLHRWKKLQSVPQWSIAGRLSVTDV